MLKFTTDSRNLCCAGGHVLRNFAGRSFRQRVIIILFITAPILASIITVPVSASDQAGMNAILLKKRQFVPEVVEKLEISKITGHAIIQFEKQPDGAIINMLARHQVNALEWIPRNAVMAYIPENAQVEAIPGIRWIGKINPTDKISDHLNQSLTKGFILVDVYPDVTDQRARSVIFKVQGEIIENHYLAPKTYLVRATEKIAAELSTVDEVSWIWPASDAIINGEPVRRCGGILTTLGPLPNYVIINEGWDGPGQGSASLKYHFVNGTSDMSGEEYEVEDALAEWAKYAQITWTETSLANQNRSVDIKWATGCHGDSQCFDGPGGILAHAASPPPDTSETLAGDVHFDDDESWCNGCYCYDTDLFLVALHEIGHSLGLDESDNSDAVMYPYYQCWSDEPEPLHQDDIDGIRSIYASRCHSCFINITSPSGSSVWECGNCYYITWNSECNRGNKVKIELYKGSSLVQTITSSTSDDGSHYWCVPADMTPASNYRIKISDKSDSSCAYDYSSYFEITCACVRVTSPSSGSIWECDRTYTIRWSRTPYPNVVEIWLTKGGGWWILGITEDDGSYNWKVPTWLEPDCGYWVMVKSTLDSSCYGESDTFCVTCPCVITVTSPTGGLWWELGDVLPIIWDSENTSGEVKIELYKGGFLERVIEESLSNTGSYDWPIPIDCSLMVSEDYQVKVAAVSDSSCYDYSNSFGIRGILGDFEPDCDVDWADLAIFVEQWLLPKLSMDVMPSGGDGIVDFLDWAVFADGWQETIDMNDIAVFVDQWLQLSAYCADIAPTPDGDGIVNMLDFAVFAENWLAGVE